MARSDLRHFRPRQLSREDEAAIAQEVQGDMRRLFGGVPERLDENMSTPERREHRLRAGLEILRAMPSDEALAQVRQERAAVRYLPDEGERAAVLDALEEATLSRAQREAQKGEV